MGVEAGSDTAVQDQESNPPAAAAAAAAVVVPVETESDMAKTSTSSSEPAPSWFTPKRLLVIFCVINMVNYVDRGAIASNGVNGSARVCTESGVCSHGSGIQGDFDLSNFKDGVISSAFMVGLLVASPIFASLAKRLVGVGEASFISLAAPFIDDNAPVTQVGNGLGWRYAFFGEAILMLPFAILGFVMKPLQMKGFSPAGSRKPFTTPETNVIEVEVITTDKDVPVLDRSSNKPSRSGLFRFWQDMKALLLEKIYVVNVLGYIAYNFVIGAYSYWGPKAGYSIYHMSNADLLFGGITIVGGIVGTLAGGIILDRMNSTIPNAFKLLSTTTFLGAIFCFSAFCFKNLYAFMVLFLIGEILVFATQGPVNFVCLHTVKPSLRPLSMAMSTVAIHVFGDVPSSPLVGIIQDNIDNWRTTALILTSILVDRYDEDKELPDATVERSNTTPLLEDETTETTAVSAQL
ncbi:Major facilitator superfamily [Cynara cardunculus var. scolymus]|uniref:Major facilitator superfamily n=1 Tax=Cynara cardunculus var. scolymus TaxID=59895 RepID=A0A118K6L7_CYNCS|nr:Major facilitator superfamily [Cynara cardunculus var. scolymus]